MAKASHKANHETVNETATDEKLIHEMNVESGAIERQEVAETDNGAGDDLQGVRARRAFMPKLLLPNRDWINANVVAKGQGAKALVGKVTGVCFEAIDKKGQLPSGEPSVTIGLVGAFVAESYVTGEIMKATTAFLPMAYAESVKAAFLADPSIKVVEIDCDLGLEATGKTIPYEWVVVAYLEGKEMERLRQLRNRRPRPAQLLLTANGK